MKNTVTHKVVLPTGDTSGKATAPAFAQIMNLLINALTKLGLLKEDLDYHVVRASMVIIYFFFGYQKWFAYEAQGLISFISNGPLISWMYPVFGIRGASWFLGVSEWLFGALLFSGFWNKKLGILGALGSCVTFIMTVTIIPFMPNGWAASAGGFPAMVGNVPFLMKDVVLFAASLPWWSAVGLAAPAPTSTASPARTRSGARKSPTWCIMPQASARRRVPSR